MATLVGDSGNNSLLGTNSSDSLSGLDGNDTILGGDGNDIIDAGDGNDSLSRAGDLGNDTIFGGAGADTILEVAGNNSLDGGAGNDSFDFVSTNYASGNAPGSDTISTGAGNDTIKLDLGLEGLAPLPDTVTDFQTGAGGDVIDIGAIFRFIGDSFAPNNPFFNNELRLLQSGPSTLLQINLGYPTASINWSTILVLQNTTAASFTSDNFYDFLSSTNGGAKWGPQPHGSMTIVDGDPGYNKLMGAEASDTIFGNGIDSLYGDSGDDILVSGSGSAFAIGGAGNDTLICTSTTFGFEMDGGVGDDSLVGGNGNLGAYWRMASFREDLGGVNANLITGRAVGIRSGNDTLVGIKDLWGGQGDDTFVGDANGNFFEGDGSAVSQESGYQVNGDDSLIGNEGNDTLDGFGGNDTLDGGPDADKLTGGWHNDLLMGGSGNDTLDGGDGSNTLTGGPGRDVFYFSRLHDITDTSDHITDFDGTDTIDLSSIAGLHFIGTAAFSNTAGEVRYVVAGSSTTILIDTDGNGLSDSQIVLDNGVIRLGESSPGSKVLIAVGPIVVENYGATALTIEGSQLFLRDSAGAGPSLKYQGVDAIAGQFGAWTPIGAANTGNGYEIAWKNSSADQYTLWNTDANGNFTGNVIGVVAGSDAALQSAETLFQQDLNGDGQIGVFVTTPIESFGVTKLATGGNRFYLQDSTGAGPLLKYQGANFVAGQFGAWAPIGAEKTGSGYEIAWKFGSADQYTLWYTDANGNFTGNASGTVAGSDPAVRSAETLFQQDLNGDGWIGVPVPTTPIESFGVTKLATGGNRFFLQDSTGAGPALKYQGANFVAGQFGAWTPIGAEKTGSGYEIAWKFGSANQYTLWNTDANGNFTGNVIGTVSGSDTTLQSAETLFQQDLNGDGQIGVPVPTTPIESFGGTKLATGGNRFYLQDSTGAGPLLKYQSANFVAGQFGAWTPIGAEKTGSGYEVAWKFGSADQYTLWNTDANGNYTGNVIGTITGSDPTLRSAETVFQQDLNGDGQIGVPVPTTPIESFGGTKLATGGNRFYLQDNTGAGPLLKYQGATFAAGQFGAWAPIGAEKTGSGYEVAWKFGSADQYTLWSLDANGNYITNLIGAVPGSDPTLQSAETLFQQDLNGNGRIGSATLIESNGATKLVTDANLFYLQDNTGAGPTLKYHGADFVAGQFGPWTPISAETDGAGYEVTWKFGSADQYTIWFTDTNGNYVSNVIDAVAGSDSRLEFLENLFHQDLNGDGHFGIFP